MRNVFEYYGDNDYLAHYGILGQKWGVRRFYDSNGRLTDQGREHYRKTYIRNNNRRERISKRLEKQHRRTERMQHKVDRFRPGLALRLIAGKEGRKDLATWHATKEYKLSKVRDREYKTKRRLERLEKRMKRRYRDIPLEELVDTDISWIRS